jgi:succinoglycan biosynthesis transport protein ExoP
MSLSHFLSMMYARRWLAVLVMLATLTTATTVILLAPRSWSATASLLIDTVRPDPVTGQSNGGNPSPTLLSTQVGVLKSERVALDVVRRLDLISDARWHKAWTSATQGRGDMSRWLAQALQKKTEIVPERDSNVVNITATAGTPEEAARTANAFARAYLDVSSTLRADNAVGVSDFFSQRADELRRSLEKARARLADFEQKNGVVVRDGHLDSETTRLSELSARWVASETMAADAEAGQAAGAAALQIQASPVLANLRSELFRAEEQLQSLAARLDDNHPELIQARAKLLALRQRVDNETRRIGNAADASRATRTRQAAELRAAVDAQRARVNRLKAAQEDGQGLAREVENLQRSYDSVQARLGQASLESHAIQGNTSLLAAAAVPFAPSSPGRMVQIGLATLLAVLLGIAAVTLMEMADVRLRTNASVASELGQPLLGVVPRPDARGSYRPRKVPLIRAAAPPRLMHRQGKA